MIKEKEFDGSFVQSGTFFLCQFQDFAQKMVISSLHTIMTTDMDVTHKFLFVNFTTSDAFYLFNAVFNEVLQLLTTKVIELDEFEDEIVKKGNAFGLYTLFPTKINYNFL